jgi:phosphoribosylanthranilate isomerase
MSRAIRDEVRLPVFLAGGLRASNVAEAIAVVQPFGVDICSGVRTDGRLNREALHAFMKVARPAS